MLKNTLLSPHLLISPNDIAGGDSFLLKTGLKRLSPKPESVSPTAQPTTKHQQQQNDAPKDAPKPTTTLSVATEPRRRVSSALARKTLTGDNAVALVAAALSDTVFCYASNDFFSQIEHPNAKMLDISTKTGVGSAILGASTVGSHVGVLTTAQNLKPMFPILHQLVRTHRPVVIHVSAKVSGVQNSSSKASIFTKTTFEPVYATLPSGILAINSSSAQECHDLAVVSHVVSQRLQLPVLHYFDGLRTGATYTSVATQNIQALEELKTIQKTPSNAIQRVDEIEATMLELYKKQVLSTHYHAFEYYGDPLCDETVFFVMGEDTQPFIEATKFSNLIISNQIDGTPVGVLRIRVVRPWSVKHFVAALPESTKTVVLVQGNASPVQKDIVASLIQRSVRFSVANYTESQKHLSAGMAIKTLKYVLSNTNDLPARFEIESIDGQVSVDLDEELTEKHFYEFSKQFVLYGQRLNEQKQMNSLIGVLSRDLSRYTQGFMQHGIANPEEQIVYSKTQLWITPTALPVTPDLVNAEMVVCESPLMLETTDALDCVKEFGKVLVFAPWKSTTDLELNISTETSKTIVSKQLQLYSVCIDTEDAAEIGLALQSGFLMLSGAMASTIALKLLRGTVDQQDEELIENVVKSLRSWTVEENKGCIPTAEAVKIQEYGTMAKIKQLIKVESKSIITPHEAAWKLMFSEAYDSIATDVRAGASSVVRVSKMQRLTPSDYSRNVFHLEFDITGTKLTYEIGEALAVYGRNSHESVMAFIEFFGCDANALYRLKSANDASCEVMTIYQLFSQVLDLFGRPSKKFYDAVRNFATDEKEKETLTAILEAKDLYKARVAECVTFVDVLQEFRSIQISLDELVKIVPNIKPRHYSIASSRKMHPTSVHLLVVLHDWTTPSGRHCIGQCSRFLSILQPGDQIAVSVCSSVMKLPKSMMDPIIMAGLGTGMAPFRAFLQEKAYLKSLGYRVGPIALYFGSRHRAKEYLYGDELDRYEAEGLITYLKCAFSRDQEYKIYIQDRIREDKEILHDLLVNKNGHFYMCGPTWPVADVRSALEEAFALADLSASEIAARFEHMKATGRYVLEVY